MCHFLLIGFVAGFVAGKFFSMWHGNVEYTILWPTLGEVTL
jgi:hypothetical protein